MKLAATGLPQNNNFACRKVGSDEEVLVSSGGPFASDLCQEYKEASEQSPNSEPKAGGTHGARLGSL